MPGISTAVGQLDVQDLVSKLMTVERAPVNAVKKRQEKINAQISDVGKLKSDLSALQASMRDLATGTFLNQYKVDSTNKDILSGSVQGDASGAVGNYRIDVKKIAQGQNLAMAGQASRTTPLAGSDANTLKFDFADGKSATVSIKAGATLEDISNAVNAAGIGVTSTIVNSGEPGAPYKLVMTGTQTGDGKAFSTSLDKPDAGLSFLAYDRTVAGDKRLTRTAQDAEVEVNGVLMRNPTNTMKEGLSGIQLSLVKEGVANLNVTRDEDAVTKKLQGFVDAYNKVRSDVDSLRNGTLKGDASILAVKETLRQITTVPISGVDPAKSYAYLAQLGITHSGKASGGKLDGSLVMDATVLKKALADDEAAVTRVFTNSNKDGVVQRLNDKINDLLGPKGILESKKSVLDKRQDVETSRLDRLEFQMQSIQARYTKQFSSLNTALDKIQSTSKSLSAMFRN